MMNNKWINQKVVIQNFKGIYNGQKGTVISIDGDSATVFLDGGGSVILNLKYLKLLINL